mgnify:CR=1 FL=1
MIVKEVMTPDPACCTAETNLQEVAKLMVDHDCGEIPVVDNQSTKKPIGVITDRDIVIRAVAKGNNPLDLTAADCMTEPCVTVTPEMLIEVERSPEPGANDLRIGMVLIALALAIAGFGLIQGSTDAIKGTAGIALFPLFVGIALLLRLRMRRLKGDA